MKRIPFIIFSTLLPTILLLFTSLFFTQAQLAYAWTGEVVGVADGDTIKVSRKGQKVKIRLYGIDTPEKRQAFGTKAKKLTNALVRGRTVDVTPITIDRYGRTVAMVHVDGTNVNETLIRNGMAWVYKKYCKLSVCSKWYKYENQARRSNKGIWADPYIEPPWEFRKAKREAKQPTSQAFTQGRSSSKYANKPVSTGSYHGNRSSRKLHRSSCRYYNCKNCTAIFHSRSAALSAGYVPCKICRP